MMIKFLKNYSSKLFKMPIYKIKHLKLKNMKIYLNELNDEDIIEEKQEFIYTFLKKYYRKVQKSHEFDNIIDFFLKLNKLNNEMFFYDFIKYLEGQYEKLELNTIYKLIELSNKLNKNENIKSIINKTFLQIINKENNEDEYIEYLFKNNCLNTFLFYCFDYNKLKINYTDEEFKEKLISNDIILNETLKNHYFKDFKKDVSSIDNYDEFYPHISLFSKFFDWRNENEKLKEFYKDKIIKESSVYINSENFYDDVHFSNIVDNLKFYNFNKLNFNKLKNQEKYFNNLNMSLQLNKNINDLFKTIDYSFIIDDKLFNRKLKYKIEVIFEELKNYNESLLKTEYLEKIIDLIIEFVKPFENNNLKYFKKGDTENEYHKVFYKLMFEKTNEFLNSLITNSSFNLDDFSLDIDLNEKDIYDDEEKNVREIYKITNEEISQELITKIAMIFIKIENINLNQKKFHLFANELLCKNFKKIDLNRIDFSELIYSIANYNLELNEYLTNFDYFLNFIENKSNNKLEDYSSLLFLITMTKTNKISYYERIIDRITNLENNSFNQIKNKSIRLAYINSLILFAFNFEIDLKKEYNIDIEELYKYNLKYNKIFGNNKLFFYMTDNLLEYCFFKNVNFDNNNYFFNLNFVQKKNILLCLTESHYNVEDVTFKGFTDLCILNLKNLSKSNIVILNYTLFEKTNKSERLEEFKNLMKNFEIDVDSKKKYLDEFYFKNLIY